MPLKKNRDLKLFYSIKEVAELFGVAESLLRYWETMFPNIHPKKGSNGQRRYTEEDIKEIELVHNLIKERGMKIAAAQKVLSKNKDAASDTAKLMGELQGIKEELTLLKQELDEL